jgi:hypothetical protein
MYLNLNSFLLVSTEGAGIFASNRLKISLEGNPLADDSDDERRLRQAETRAIRKRKASFPKEPPKTVCHS